MSNTMLHRLSLVLAFLSLSSSVISASVPHDHDHDHQPVYKRLPGTWYQREDHPVHDLFRRDVTGDGTSYAAVGSSAWGAGFPSGKPDPTKLPQEWVDALNSAIASGAIPSNVPVSTQNNGMPTYGGLDPSGAQVCSTTYQCNKNPNVLWDAPDGVFGVSFDDGPLPGTSDTLYAFLKENGVHATHFFIGVNILNNPKEFTTAFDTNEDDIAVHTWTHPYMTTLSNEDILGELGWTMYIIHNSTGGRVPKYWRPPYGDADNRVIAIAQAVFGLKTVIWNHDTADWSIGESGGATSDSVHASLQKWLTGPKSPGLICLEHELTDNTVNAFINAFPLIKSNGWNMVSVAELDGGPAYQNADSDEGTVTPVTGILYNGAAPSNASSSSNSTASIASSNSTSSTPATTKSTSSASATNSIVTSSGTSSVNGTAGPGGQGSKQANITMTSSSTSQSPSGSPVQKQQQQNGASPLVQMAFVDIRSLVAAMFTFFVSALALA